MRSTHEASRNISNKFVTLKNSFSTPRTTSNTAPLEDTCTQNRNKQKNNNNILPCTYNKQTIYSQTARSPPPIVQFNSFTLGSPCWQALASFQFKVEVLRKTESRKPPYGSGPDD